MEDYGYDDDVTLFGQPIIDDPFSAAPSFDFDNSRKLEADMKIQTTHDDKVKKVLARETDAARHKTVPNGIARALAKGRIAVSMTQRQLAARLNVDYKHIAAIEAGTAIYDAPEIRKMRLFLGLTKFDFDSS